MKDTHIIIAAIIILSLILAGAVITAGHETDSVESQVQEQVKNTLDLRESTIQDWSNVKREGDGPEFQKYIDLYNTTYDLWNYKSGIISLNDYLTPIISFIENNPTEADEIYIYREYYKAYFDFEDENGEIKGETEYKCTSPQQCYDITMFMADNSELKQIFSADCTPLFDEYEYFCYLECRYDSGEEAFVIFHNHQAVLYYQDEEIMNSFDRWFDGISEYH